MQSVWDLVAQYTQSLWWFDLPAFVALGSALVVVVVALLRLHQQTLFARVFAVASLSCAVALLVPGALLGWRPAATLGIDTTQLSAIPTARFMAIGQTLDQLMHMGYLGSGLVLVSMLSVFGLFGRSAHGETCPACGRSQHPSWAGECPECLLMQPSAAEAPLMRVGDLSASGVPITQFGSPAHTELLDNAPNDAAWVEIVQGTSGVGERYAINARLAIGRDQNECRLVIDDESVSSRHAYIECAHQTFVLSDWGSRNGTYVNDQLIAQHTLQHDDCVRIGRVTLRFSTTPTVENTRTELISTEVNGAQLVALGGAVDGAVFAIQSIDVQIGRSNRNDVVLHTATVSRHHASIRFDGMAYYIVDADSPNGTWVDDARVIGSTLLQPGQIIRLGTQQVRFEYQEACHVEC